MDIWFKYRNGLVTNLYDNINVEKIVFGNKEHITY